MPCLVPIVNEIIDILQGMCKGHGLTDTETPMTRLNHVVVVAVRGNILTEKVVEISIQSSCSHRTAVFTFQCSRCCIAWVGEKWVAGRLALKVETFETLPRHEHFAPDFKVCRPACTGRQLQGNSGNSADIGCNIVPLLSVTACERTRKKATIVGE